MSRRHRKKWGGGGEAGFLQRYLLLWVILGSVLSFLFSSRYLYSSAMVVGRSMEPALLPGERRMVNHWTFRLTGVQRGDLVVLEEPTSGLRVIKRVIAAPGDTLELRQGQVHLNQRLLKEPYLPAGTRTFPGSVGAHPFTLGKDEYFVMGDNRSRSLDSRSYGPVRQPLIQGTVEP